MAKVHAGVDVLLWRPRIEALVIGGLSRHSLLSLLCLFPSIPPSQFLSCLSAPPVWPPRCFVFCLSPLFLILCLLPYVCFLPSLLCLAPSVSLSRLSLPLYIFYPVFLWIDFSRKGTKFVYIKIRNSLENNGSEFPGNGITSV